MLSSHNQALFEIGCTLISSYYLRGSFAKIPLKHNSYFSKFWIKWYSSVTQNYVGDYPAGKTSLG